MRQPLFVIIIKTTICIIYLQQYTYCNYILIVFNKQYYYTDSDIQYVIIYNQYLTICILYKSYSTNCIVYLLYSTTRILYRKYYTKSTYIKIYYKEYKIQTVYKKLPQTRKRLAVEIYLQRIILFVKESAVPASRRCRNAPA